ncbi:MAG: sensor histidine kinase [Planctomycetota bacterium]
MRTLRTRMVLAFGGVFLAAWLVLGWWIAQTVSRQATAHLQDRVKQLARLVATTVAGHSIVRTSPENADAILNGLQRTFSLWEGEPADSTPGAPPRDDIEIMLIMTQTDPDVGPGEHAVTRHLYGTFPDAERQTIATELQDAINPSATAGGSRPNMVWATQRFPTRTVLIHGSPYQASITSWLELLPQPYEVRPPFSPLHPVETIEAWKAAANGMFFDQRLHGNLPPSMQPLTRRNDLLVLYPVSAVDAARAQALQPILPLGVLVLVTVLIFSYWLASRLSRSLAALAANADAVARGELDTPIVAAAPTEEVARLKTAFVHMLEGLRDSRGKLAQAERLAAIGTLATAVAHDIRTPLTAIKMTVDLQLDRSARAGGDLKPFQVIQAELERLRILADSLIDFARNPPPALAPVALRGLIDACTTLLLPQFKHHRVAWEVQIEPPDMVVLVDPRRFRQVLLNLAINAIEATEREGLLRFEAVRLPDANPGATPAATPVAAPTAAAGAQSKLEPAPMSSSAPAPAPPAAPAATPATPDAPASPPVLPARHWRLTLTDHGSGIPADILPRIFEPLISSKPAGGGLGLSICRQIVEAHGGTIHAQSPVADGRGTRIVIEF